MNCEVRDIPKILRYRMLTIDGEVYILDLWGSFWKIIFPFLFWMLPNRVYKVDNLNAVEKLKSTEIKQNKTGHSSILGAGSGLFLALFLKPLSDYLSIPGSPLTNSVILLIIVLLMFVLCVSVNNMLENKLYNIVNLKRLSTYKLWIKPKSIKHFFQIVAIYFFFLALTVLFFVMSIKDPDVITLIFTMIAMFFLLLCSVGPVTMGTTIVKFKCSSETAV